MIRDYILAGFVLFGGFSPVYLSVYYEGMLVTYLECFYFYYIWYYKPQRMHRRVTVVCLSVCMSFTALTALLLNSAVQAWYLQN